MSNPRITDKKQENKERAVRPRGARAEEGLTCKRIFIGLMLASAGAIGLKRLFEGSPVNMEALTPKEKADFLTERGGYVEARACNFVGYPGGQPAMVPRRSMWESDVVYTPPVNGIDRTVDCLGYKLANTLNRDQSFKKGFKKEYISEFQEALKNELAAHEHQYPHEMKELTFLLSTRVVFAHFKVIGGAPSQSILYLIENINVPGWSGMKVNFLLDSPYEKGDFIKAARDIIKNLRERNMVFADKQISAHTSASPSLRGRRS